ncbi:MAG: hypothetical protein RMM16_11685, partial [Chloroherpetonaceae bacterium]|nr:hypothetical protein [Chloroherpetonaceae bacterium]
MMRKILIAACCLLSSTGLFSQDKPTQSNQVAETADDAAFVSPLSVAPANASRARQAHLQGVENINAILHDNGPLVTHPGQGAGGADASAITTGTNFGFGHSPAAFLRVADNFTVPGGQQWTLDSVWFYAYQTGSTTTSTITSVNVRIWQGQPDQTGSTIVFGDTTTNRMIGTRFSNIYRVTSTTLTNNQRPIMLQTVNLNGLTLNPGTYWIDWQTGGSLASGPWVPPVSILGQPVVPGANALQRSPAGVWAGLVDGTNPVELPFVLHGSVQYTTPFFTASPASVAFGTINVGSSSSAQTISLSNTGGGTLTITGISLTGADASQF